MPKRKLPWIPRAVYHVTIRGNRKNEIFNCREDYLMYLEFLEEAIEYYDFQYEILAYTLMTNHVHLLIKTKETHICLLMGRVNKRYATEFNKKYNYVGHLFQTRYNGVLIESDRQLLEESRYIHLNPVRAQMVQRPEDYPYSSYPIYMGITEENIIHTNLLLSYFKDSNKELYRSYVETPISPVSGR